MSRWLPRVFLFLLAMGFAVYSGRQYFQRYIAAPLPPQVTEPDEGLRVSAAVAGRETLAEYITLNGVTRFLKTSTIRSHLTGYVSSLRYSINSYIKPGEEFCTVKTKEQDALREIQRIDTSLRMFNKPLSVVSNAGGLITTLNIHNGDYVSEGDVLAIVTEPASLILVVNVPYEYNRQIHTGTACEVQLSDNKKLKLSISGILPTVEATSQTQSYYIRLPDHALPENLNVTVKLMTKQTGSASLTVPVAALQSDELEKEFWVMKIKQGYALKRPVTIGTRTQDWIEIRSGDLVIGDSVVTDGSYQLADSSRISVIP